MTAPEQWQRDRDAITAESRKLFAAKRKRDDALARYHEAQKEFDDAQQRFFGALAAFAPAPPEEGQP